MRHILLKLNTLVLSQGSICRKQMGQSLTYATKLTPMPKVLLQLNKSEEYTENKYTETMTC